MWHLSYGEFHPGKPGGNLEIPLIENEAIAGGRVLRMRRSVAKAERSKNGCGVDRLIFFTLDGEKWNHR
jgi:hypothetical protein